MTRLSICVLLFSVAGAINAQHVPASDPQALTLTAQAVASLTGGARISDATLIGNVTWTLGSDQQVGSANLLAKGFGESRIDLDLSGGNRSEVRNINGTPNEGNWIGPDGIIHAIALHNCFTDAGWFFPSLGSLAAAGTNPNVVLTYLGLDRSLQHIRAYTYDAHLPDAQQLSVIDFYLDSQTLLPQVLTFNEHPDNDQTVNIAVEVMFSDYRAVNGAMFPFHVQRYVNNSLTLDIQITSVVINSGISDAQFVVQ